MPDYNDTGWVVVYDRDAKAGSYETSEDVHSWDNEGNALIVDRKTGSLVLAAKREGFKRLEETSRIVAAIPAAPGWNLKIWERDAPDTSTFVAPIAAWLVTATGQVVPVSSSNDDYLEPLHTQRSQIHAPGESTD
ncbi:hypothetical protein ACIBG5_10910 [Kribbella sp. NPDC050241]|uniref:hypothetical protein n=1 Tax=Kribbella sp. NPDC050241 TaxID=3364115 RepID=UPI0037B9259D